MKKIINICLLFLLVSCAKEIETFSPTNNYLEAYFSNINSVEVKVTDVLLNTYLNGEIKSNVLSNIYQYMQLDTATREQRKPLIQYLPGKSYIYSFIYNNYVEGETDSVKLIFDPSNSSIIKSFVYGTSSFTQSPYKLSYDRSNQNMIVALEGELIPELVNDSTIVIDVIKNLNALYKFNYNHSYSSTSGNVYTGATSWSEGRSTNLISNITPTSVFKITFRLKN